MANKRLSVSVNADTSGFKKSVSDMKSSMNDATGGIKKSLGGIGGAISGAIGGFGKIAGAIGAWKLIDGAINMVSGSVEGAISRFDTLNQFPKMMKIMGYETGEVEKATEKLKQGIQGLPTPLGDVVKGTQRFVNIFQDVGKATDTTLALNNAFLASGASAQDASRGTDQYAQMLTKGQADLESWKTLQETMPYALQKTAEAMGFTGRSAQRDLYDALQSGQVTMDDFNNKVIELSTTQGGFAEVALEASKGIATSWTNIKTAITNGVAGVITAFDEWLNSNGFGGIAGILDGMKVKVGEFFTIVSGRIPAVLDFFLNLFNSIGKSTAFQTLKEVVTDAVGAFKDWIGALESSGAIDTIVSAVGELWQAILELDFKQIISDVGAFLDKWSPLIAGILVGIGAFNVLSTVVPLVVGAFKGFMILKSLVSTVGLLSTASTLLAPILGAVSLPLVGIAVAIGAVIAIGVLLYKNWDTIKAKTIEIWGAIQEFFSGVWESIKTRTQEAWSSIAEFFTGLWGSITANVQEAWNGIVDFFTNLWTSIVSLAVTIWTPIQEFFTGLWQGVKSVFEVTWNAIKLVLTVVLGAILVVVATIWNSIADAINARLAVIRAVISTVWQGIQVVINTVMNVIKNTILPIWESIKAGITNVVNTIKSTVTNIWNNIMSVTSSVFNAVKSVVTSIWNSIRGAIQTALNAIKSVVTSVWNTIRNSIISILNAISSVIMSIWNVIRSAISTAVNAIRSVITTAWNAILSVIRTILNNIKATVSSVWNSIRSAVSSAVSAVGSTVSNTFNSLKNTVSRIWNSIKTAIENPIKQARNTVKSMIDNIKGFFNFNWKLPRLKMPRFSVSGSANPLDWLKQGVPKLNVSWFATGGIATGASVVGIGEKGDEAIVPLSQKHRMKPFAQAVASMLPDKSESTGSQETIITGNTFVVREEADINKISKELYKLQQKGKFAKGS